MNRKRKHHDTPSLHEKPKREHPDTPSLHEKPKIKPKYYANIDSLLQECVPKMNESIRFLIRRYLDYPLNMMECKEEILNILNEELKKANTPEEHFYEDKDGVESVEWEKPGVESLLLQFQSRLQYFCQNQKDAHCTKNAQKLWRNEVKSNELLNKVEKLKNWEVNLSVLHYVESLDYFAAMNRVLKLGTWTVSIYFTGTTDEWNPNLEIFEPGGKLYGVAGETLVIDEEDIPHRSQGIMLAFQVMCEKEWGLTNASQCHAIIRLILNIIDDERTFRKLLPKTVAKNSDSESDSSTEEEE